MAGTKDKVSVEQLTAALERVDNCELKYREANKAADEASRNRTDALNNLNDAQKIFDELLTAFCGKSAFGSHWNEKNKYVNELQRKLDEQQAHDTNEEVAARIMLGGGVKK